MSLRSEETRNQLRFYDSPVCIVVSCTVLFCQLQTGQLTGYLTSHATTSALAHQVLGVKGRAQGRKPTLGAGVPRRHTSQRPRVQHACVLWPEPARPCHAVPWLHLHDMDGTTPPAQHAA